MKLSHLILFPIVAVVSWLALERAGIVSTPRTDDPVATMQAMVRRFPAEASIEGFAPRSLYGVAYNVKKTDSLSAPIVGTITFTEFFAGTEIPYELVFHWQDGRWEYERLICLSSQVNTPLFADRMESAPEIMAFTHGGAVPAPRPADTRSAAVAPTPRSAQISKPTPGWDRYGNPIRAR
jgi:hypothetical protein